MSCLNMCFYVIYNAANVKAAMDKFSQPAMILQDEEEFVNSLLKPIPVFKTSVTAKEENFEKLEQLKEARSLLSQLAEKLTKNA